MSTRQHFVPTHHVARRSSRFEEAETMTASEVHSRLATMLTAIGGLGVLAGAWGGLAPFVGPTFNYTADGGGSWHWDLARAMLAALPGAAAVVAGLLVVACARSVALAIGRGGVLLAGMVMFASGAWLALGPSAWPVLWNDAYFVHSSAIADFGRSAGFAAGPGLVLAVGAGFLIGALMLRDRGRLVTENVESVRPVETSGTRNAALSSDVENDDASAEAV
jgi:hypothetical protein